MKNKKLYCFLVAVLVLAAAAVYLSGNKDCVVNGKIVTLDAPRPSSQDIDEFILNNIN